MCSRRPAPFNLFWLRSLAHAGAAAVLVDEFNGGFFKCSSDFVSGCLPAVKPKPAAAYERREIAAPSIYLQPLNIWHSA